MEGLCPIADVGADSAEAATSVPTAVADGDGRGRHYMSRAPGYATREETAKEAYVSSKTNVSVFARGGGGAGARPGQGQGQGHLCTFCGYEFSARSNLRRHVRDHHESADPSAALCPVCGKNCRNRSNVLTHMYRVHRVTARQLNSFGQSFGLPPPPHQHHPGPSLPSPSSISDGQLNHRPGVEENLPSQSTATPCSIASGQSQSSGDLSQGLQAYGLDLEHQQQHHHHHQEQQPLQQISYGYERPGSNLEHHH